MNEFDKHDLCDCGHERQVHGDGHRHCHGCNDCKRFTLYRKVARPS